MLGLQAGPDALPGQHLVDGGVLADVAEELEQRDRLRPLAVVDEAARPTVEVDDAADLRLDRRHVAVERVVVEQVALLGAPARVADHAGRPAGQGDRHVAGVLEAAQHDQPDQVAVVQAVGRRVAAVVDGDRPAGQAGGERVAVGRLLDEAAGVEIGEQVHRAAVMLARRRSGSTAASAATTVTACVAGNAVRHDRTVRPWRRDARRVRPDVRRVRRERQAAGAAVRPPRRGHRRRPRAGRTAAAGPADAAPAGAAAGLRPRPPARRSATTSWPGTTRTSREHPDPGDPVPAFRALLPRQRRRAGRAARHPEHADQRDRSLRPAAARLRSARRRGRRHRPPRRRHERRAQPAARPLRVRLRAWRGGRWSVDGAPRVRHPRARARAAGACRRSCSAAGSTGRRSTSTTPTSDAGWRPASGRTRPTASSGCGRRSSSPRASSSTSARVTPSPTRRRSPPRSTPTRSSPTRGSSTTSRRRAHGLPGVARRAGDATATCRGSSPRCRCWCPSCPSATPTQSDSVLVLVRWRGGRRSVEHLAVAHPHGYWLHWEQVTD